MKNKKLSKNTILISFLILTLWACGCGQNNQAAQEQPPEDPPVEAPTAGADQAADTAGGDTEASSAGLAGAAVAAVGNNAAEEEVISGPESNVVGIIIDATDVSVGIQTPDGALYYLTIPDTGVNGNLSFITVGQMATLTYRGTLDENHAVLTGISDSSMVTGIYVEEYAFAIKIMTAVRDMDMEELSDLSNFPVFLDTGNYYGSINTSGEFEAINNEKIFTKELVDRIVNFNLFQLQYTDAGFVMGDGGPNITFEVDGDGILGIIGINCTATAR